MVDNVWKILYLSFGGFSTIRRCRLKERDSFCGAFFRTILFGGHSVPRKARNKEKCDIEAFDVTASRDA
jgi:hypothetical protein